MFASFARFVATALLATSLVSAAAISERNSDDDKKVGYLLATFPVEDEAVYFELSNGNDAHSFSGLSRNGSQAILRSDVGTKGARDHFIVPSHDGSKFWLHSTDLMVNAFEGQDFNAATRFGSRSIVIWESDDLVNWSEPRLSAPLVNSSAGNAWAAESYWDHQQQAYIVVFASRFWSPSDPDRTGAQPPNVLMYVTTTDFVHFTEAKTYFHPVYPVIDATFLKRDCEGPNVWYRWVKNEYNFKIFQQRSSTGIRGKWTNVGNAPNGTYIEYASQYENNEGPLIFVDNKDPGLFHLWIDENTKQSYIPSTARTLDDMSAWKAQSLKGFPSSIKHGKVLALNQKQYNRISKKYHKV